MQEDAKDSRSAAYLAAALILVSGVFLGILQLKPGQNDRDVALVFSPNKSLTEIVTALSTLPVKFVRTGFADFIVIVRPENLASFGQLKSQNLFLTVSAFSDGGCVFLDRKLKPKGSLYERVKRT